MLFNRLPYSDEFVDMEKYTLTLKVFKNISDPTYYTWENDTGLELVHHFDFLDSAIQSNG